MGWGGSDPVGDGGAFVARGIVVVTFNYRLGALGFLDLSDSCDACGRFTGSPGLLDQIEALRWVHDNIACFGGDPGDVTVYGISAGGKSASNLLSSSACRGLFRRAIVSSGGGSHVAQPEDAQAITRRLLQELDLSHAEIAELWDIAPADLVAAQEAIATGARASWVWRPVLGGSVLPQLPTAAIANGVAAGVPLLIGHNGNEAATFDLWDPSATDQAPRVLTEILGEPEAHTVRNTYRKSRPGLDERGISMAILGDERYGIPTIRLADAHAPHAPVWRYRMDSRPPGVPMSLAGGHGMDALMIWGGAFQGASDEDGELAALSHAMLDCWSSFILRGVPDSANLPDWPRYDASRTTMILDTPARIEPDPKAEERRAWDGREWLSGTWWNVLSSEAEHS